MVCLTSCVFRSIRFSGFARPHFGVRREGELYTRLQGDGKRSMVSPRDAHKSGNDSDLSALSRPGRLAGPQPAHSPIPRSGPGAIGRPAALAHHGIAHAQCTPRTSGPPRVEANLVRRLTPESQVPLLVNISSLRGSAPTRFRRPGYTAARQTSGRRPRSPAISGVAASPLIRAGTQAVRRVRDARSSVRAFARTKSMHFFATPPADLALHP